MYKEAKLLNIFLSLLISFFLVILFKNIFLDYKNISVELSVKHEKSINFQTFYIEEIGEWFNENKSIRQFNSSANNEFQIISFDLKNVKKLVGLRIDLGEQPENIWIKNIKILGQKKIEITPEKLIDYSMNEIQEKKLENESVKLYSDKYDPFIILKNSDVRNMQREVINYKAFIFIYIFLFILAYFLIIFIDRKILKMSKGQ